MINVALTWLEGVQHTYPRCTVESGVAFLALNGISVHWIEASKGCGDCHALTRRESYPCSSLVDGYLIPRGVHWYASQRERAGCAHLDHVHLADVENHAGRWTPLSVAVGDVACLRFDCRCTRGPQSICNGSL